jgi:hypothetical protein
LFFLESIHKTIAGIRQCHAMRMIPGNNGIMLTDKVQLREYSCACSNCVTGGECTVVGQNPWKTGKIILKNLPVIPLPVNPNQAHINENESEEENDDLPWDFWDY